MKELEVIVRSEKMPEIRENHRDGIILLSSIAQALNIATNSKGEKAVN